MSFAKQFGLGFHPETEVFAAIPMLEEVSEWAVPVKKDASPKRFSARFSFLEGLLVYGGELSLISRVDLVKPFLTLTRRECLEVASMDRGGPKIPLLVQKRGLRTMVVRARSGAGRNLFLTFFVSEASVVVEGRRS